MSEKKQRVVYQERLPHREAVQRLLRAYSRLLLQDRASVDADQDAKGQKPTSVQESAS